MYFPRQNKGKGFLSTKKVLSDISLKRKHHADSQRIDFGSFILFK